MAQASRPQGVWTSDLLTLHLPFSKSSTGNCLLASSTQYKSTWQLEVNASAVPSALLFHSTKLEVNAPPTKIFPRDTLKETHQAHSPNNSEEQIYRYDRTDKII